MKHDADNAFGTQCLDNLHISPACKPASASLLPLYLCHCSEIVRAEHVAYCANDRMPSFAPPDASCEAPLRLNRGKVLPPRMFEIRTQAVRCLNLSAREGRRKQDNAQLLFTTIRGSLALLIS
jgi:hypothetical protein